MAKNLINGENIIVEENLDNINLNLSSTYTNTLNTRLANIDANIESKTSYSTTETVVGRWINGKPLYRKVIEMGQLPNETIKVVPTGYEATEIVVRRLSGIGVYSANGLTFPMPHVSGISSELVKLTVNSGNVVVQTYSNRENADGYVVLEYTKTTD